MNVATIQYGFRMLGFIWYLAMFAISVLGCTAARRRYRSRPVPSSSHARTFNRPGVSILRPLKGLDTNLYENLESTFKLDYLNFEIIFSVADENDQALLIVQALRNRYPSVKASVIIGEEVVGVNPKVNNLIRPFKVAAHNILWVLDSGVMVDPGTLERSVETLTRLRPSSKRKIGLIHHVPFALIDETKIGSRLEAAFLNTNHAKMYIAINAVGIDSCVVGKSNLYYRSDIERLDGSLIPIQSQTPTTREPRVYGLAAFSRFLAEDNMIASSLWHELGLRHDLSYDVARNVVGNMTFSDYVWRRVRWIRVRKRMVLAATILEPFTESVVLYLVGNLTFRLMFDLPIWVYTIVHFLTWLSIDLDVFVSISGHGLRREEASSFLQAWVGREFLAFPIWLIAMFGDDVMWRGRSYKVLKNGEAMLCSE